MPTRTRRRRIYLLSYLAHAEFPTEMVKFKDLDGLKLGTVETCNKRTIYKAIYREGIRSCQLVMGFTLLDAGLELEHDAVAHAHAPQRNLHVLQRRPGAPRRAPDGAAAGNAAPVCRPTARWSCRRRGASIQASGTKAYGFCWGMGGENQAYDDMDGVAITELR